MFTRPRNRKKPKINIVPLIDIIFLMLVFFMLATNFERTKEVNFSLGKTVIPLEIKSKILFIKILNNKFEINKKKLSEEEFENHTIKLWKTGDFDQVVILNDRISKIETLIFTMDTLKKNKITNVSFSDEFRK